MIARPFPLTDLRLVYLFAFIVCGFFGLFGSVNSILTGVAGLLALVALLTHRIPVLHTRAAKLMTVLCLLYVGGGLFALALHPDDPANQQHALMRLAVLWFLPLASSLALLDGKSLRKAIKTGAAAGAIATLIFVALELSLWRARAWGGAGNPGPFATVMTVQFGICTAAVFSAKNRWQSVLYLIASVAAALCVLASGMRTVFPALLLIPLFCFLQMQWQTGGLISARKSTAARLLIPALILLGGTIYYLQSDRLVLLWQEVNISLEGEITDTSLGQRLAMWQYARNELAGNWPAGVGLEKALDAMDARTEELYGFGINKTHFHNIIATALLRGGVVDLLSVLALWFSPLIVLFVAPHNAPPVAKCLLASLFLSYSLMALANLAFGHDILDHFFIAMMAISIALLNKDANESAGVN